MNILPPIYSHDADENRVASGTINSVSIMYIIRSLRSRINKTYRFEIYLIHLFKCTTLQRRKVKQKPHLLQAVIDKIKYSKLKLNNFKANNINYSRNIETIMTKHNIHSLAIISLYPTCFEHKWIR